MALINPEVVAIARVNVDEGGVPSYDFANGFDSAEVAGAAPGASVIRTVSPGVFQLFLSEPVDPGEPVKQGGYKANVASVAVATPSTPSPVPVAVDLVATYGDYGMTGSYAGVNPEKTITVRATVNGTPFVGAFKFDIDVVRNPVTNYGGRP